MQPIKYPVEKLREILTKNRDEHASIFEEAQVGYRKAMIEELDKMLVETKEGKRIRRTVTLIEPMNQTYEYDKVLKMLELTDETHIVLTEHDFAQYVMDDWSWKHQWAVSNSTYSAKAAGIVDSIEHS